MCLSTSMVNKPQKNIQKMISKTKKIIATGSLFGALIAGDPFFAQSNGTNNKATTTIDIQKDTNNLKRMTTRLEKNAEKEGIPGKDTLIKMFERATIKKKEDEFIAMIMIINYIYKDTSLTTEEEKFAYAVFFAGNGKYKDRMMKRIDTKKLMEYVRKESKFGSEVLDIQIAKLKEEYEKSKQEYEKELRINNMLKDL